MKPVETGTTNLTYHGRDEVADLPCRRVRAGMICSVWEFDDAERALIAAGGRVELAIFVEPIPPVSLVVIDAQAPDSRYGLGQE